MQHPAGVLLVKEADRILQLNFASAAHFITLVVLLSCYFFDEIESQMY
jgi:hypothetical protein